MSNTLEIVIKGADHTGQAFGAVTKNVRGLGDAAGGVVKSLAGIGKTIVIGALGTATAATGALGAALLTTIGPASDLNETISKVGVVFGDHADEVLAFGQGAAGALGMSKEAALAAAGTYGNLFRSMGLTEDVSADMSTELVQLASDLGSFNNMDPEIVLEKLRAGLTGETEPLKTLGVNLNQAMLEAKAMEMGLIGVDEEMTAAAKAQAAYAIMMEQTTLAQGDFARTSGGLANQQRTLGATFTDLKSTIGTALLPTLETLSGKVTTFTQSERFQEWVGRATELLAGLAEKVGKVVGLLLDGDVSGALGEMFGPELASQIMAIADAVGAFVSQVATFVTEHSEEFKAALIAIGAVIAAATIASAIAGIAGAIAALANPVTLVILAVGLLAAAWQGDWGGIRTTITAFWNETLKPFIDDLVKWFTTTLPNALASVRDWFVTAWGKIQATVQVVWQRLVNIWNALSTVFTVTIPTAGRSLWESLQRTLADIKEGFETVWNGILGFLKQLWDDIRVAVLTAIILVLGLLGTNLDEIQEKWETVWDDVKEFVTTTWDNIYDKVSGAIEDVQEYVKGKIDTLQGQWETVWGAVKTFAGDTWDDIYDKASTIIEDVREYVKGKVEALQEKWEEIWGKVETFAKDTWDAIKGKVEEILPAIIGVIEGKAEELKSSFLDPITDAYDAIVAKVGDWAQLGRDLLDGLIGGFKEKVGSLIGSVKSAIDDAVAEAKDRLGIGSPSKVFAEIGRDLMAGLSVGIDATARMPAMAVAGATSAVVAAGRSEVHNHVHYEVNPQYYAYQDERSVAQDVRLLSMLAGA